MKKIVHTQVHIYHVRANFHNNMFSYVAYTKKYNCVHENGTFFVVAGPGLLCVQITIILNENLKIDPFVMTHQMYPQEVEYRH